MTHDDSCDGGLLPDVRLADLRRVAAMSAAEREAKRQAWLEAGHVAAAFAEQVASRRWRWCNAGDARELSKARAELAEAVAQHDAAKAREAALWKAWHGTG